MIYTSIPKIDLGRLPELQTYQQHLPILLKRQHTNITNVSPNCSCTLQQPTKWLAVMSIRYDQHINPIRKMQLQEKTYWAPNLADNVRIAHTKTEIAATPAKYINRERERERECVCVLRLPREKQPRPNGDHAHRSFAWQPHERQPLPNGDHARRSSAWQLCVLRLPGERQPRPNGDDARCNSLCVPRLPRERQPRPNGDHARRSSSRRFCVLRLPRERRAAALPGGSVYSACHARGSRGPTATTRAAAPPGGSVYCACHARGAPQLFQQALCTPPATREAAAAQRRPRATSPAWQLCVQRLPHTRQPQPFKK